MPCKGLINASKNDVNGTLTKLDGNGPIALLISVDEAVGLRNALTGNDLELIIKLVKFLNSFSMFYGKF